MTSKPKTLNEILKEWEGSTQEATAKAVIEDVRTMLMERVKELQSEADKPENHDKLTYAYIAGQKWELLRIAGKERKWQEKCKDI